MEGNSIDVNLYSNLDSETNEKFEKYSIFIYGLRGLGIEIAKNVILAGPKQLTICDQTIIKERDLSSNFYFSEQDVNKNKREDVCLDNLKNLSSSVAVEKFEGKLQESIDKLRNFNIVIITEMLNKKIINTIDSLCRECKIGFIFTCSLGLSGFAFVDFNDFIIFDETGEENKKYTVKSISKDTSGVVVIDEYENFSLKSGDYVIFKEVVGMNEVNESPPRPIRVIQKNTFTIEDTTKFGDYISGGIIEQVKVPKPVEFKDFKESTQNPNLNNKHFIIETNEREKELHLIFISLIDYFSNKGNLPEYNDEKALDDVINIINDNIHLYKNKNWIIKDLNLTLIKKVCTFSKCHLAPITSFLGGVVSQEIIKYTGKFVPIDQWFHFEFNDIIPDRMFQNRIISNEIKSRYEDQIIVFGEDFQKKLSDLNVLIVGSGKYGFELIKNCALIGLSSNSGKTIVTDYDFIDNLVLNRTLFVDKKNLERRKSKVICETALKINKDCKYIDLQNRFDISNEDFFDEGLWKDIDYVFSTLKNKKSKKIFDYVTNYCMKILYDISADDLTKAHFKYIIPNVTDSYDESYNKSHQITIKYFPSSYEHCIQWARELFNCHFHQNLKLLHQYIETPERLFEYFKAEHIHNHIEKMQEVLSLLEILNTNSFEKCLEVSYNIFYREFNNKISNLTFNYPLKYISPETKLPLWSGLKKFPHPIDFNPNQKHHISFLYVYSVILAETLGIKYPEKDEHYILETIKKFTIKKHSPVINISNIYTEEVVKEIIRSQEIFLLLKKELLSKDNSSLSNKIFSPAILKLDNEASINIEFINISANIRGSNYGIEEPTLPITLNVLGKKLQFSSIYSCLSGLTILQFFYQLNCEDKNNLRNCDINFIDPKFTFKPIEIKKEYTWQRMELEGPLTLKGFFEIFCSKYRNLSIRLIFCKGLLIFENYVSKLESLDLDKKIEELVSEKVKLSNKTNLIILQLDVFDQNNQRVFFPLVKYSIK